MKLWIWVIMVYIFSPKYSISISLVIFFGGIRYHSPSHFYLFEDFVESDSYKKLLNEHSSYSHVWTLVFPILICFLWVGFWLLCLLFTEDLLIIFYLWMCNNSLKLLSAVQLLEMMYWRSEMPLKFLLKCLRKMLTMFQTLSNATLYLCQYGRSWGKFNDA